mmetsp:Transcript_56739/g.164586  ORF Transcript_56739/g.164586 Transcript_56739/m.164586 type:complete len:228 (+) Transcript_56739:528-1211(+)
MVLGGHRHVDPVAVVVFCCAFAPSSNLAVGPNVSPGACCEVVQPLACPLWYIFQVLQLSQVLGLLLAVASLARLLVGLLRGGGDRRGWAYLAGSACGVRRPRCRGLRALGDLQSRALLQHHDVDERRIRRHPCRERPRGALVDAHHDRDRVLVGICVGDYRERCDQHGLVHEPVPRPHGRDESLDGEPGARSHVPLACAQVYARVVPGAEAQAPPANHRLLVRRAPR